MNFNDLRLNAYKNVNKNNSEEQNIEKKIERNNVNLQKSEKVVPVYQALAQKNNSETPFFQKVNKLFEPVLNGKNQNPDLKSNLSSAGGLIKVPAPVQDTQDSVYRRVAKFLVLIGVDEAAKVLPHLTQEQTEKIIPEIASIKSISPDEAEQILQEFQFLIQQSRESGGIGTAQTILEKAFGKEKAQEVLDKTVPFKNGKPFDYLEEADSDKITALLKDEASYVRALVLSHIQPKTAAQVINSLPENEKKEVILRLAKLKEIDPETLKRVDKAMQEKVNKITVIKSDSINGQSTLAEILKRMNPKAEEEILNRIADDSPEISENLRELLFTTQDILNSDDRFIQNKIRDMSDEDAALLIAGKEEKFREKILSNVSENRKKQILDTEEIKKPMRRSDIDKVTSQFFSDLRRAYDDGELYIKGRDEDYV